MSRDLCRMSGMTVMAGMFLAGILGAKALPIFFSVSNKLRVCRHWSDKIAIYELDT